jgi:hypothetical protein
VGQHAGPVIGPALPPRSHFRTSDKAIDTLRTAPKAMAAGNQRVSLIKEGRPWRRRSLRFAMRTPNCTVVQPEGPFWEQRPDLGLFLSTHTKNSSFLQSLAAEVISPRNVALRRDVVTLGPPRESSRGCVRDKRYCTGKCTSGRRRRPPSRGAQWNASIASRIWSRRSC